MANTEEQAYLDMLRDLLQRGDERTTRNGTTRSLFSRTLSFDLEQGFPLLTTKRMFFRGIFEELMMFLRGATDTKQLEAKGVNIWKGNTSREFLDSVGLKDYAEGDMGPMYGFNLLHFGADYKGAHHDYAGQGVDQLQRCLDALLHDPFSRRIVMTAFNPAQAHLGCLYPCHSIVVQFYVRPLADGRLSVSQQMYQRSADAFLGEPYNIASSALLSTLVCHHLNHVTGSDRYVPGMLHIVLGDYHLYEPHYEAAKEQVDRTPGLFPKLRILRTRDRLQDYEFGDIELVGYESHPALKAPMVA
jgi:thymidylate synthase